MPMLFEPFGLHTDAWRIQAGQGTFNYDHHRLLAVVQSISKQLHMKRGVICILAVTNLVPWLAQILPVKELPYVPPLIAEVFTVHCSCVLLEGPRWRLRGLLL